MTYRNNTRQHKILIPHGSLLCRVVFLLLVLATQARAQINVTQGQNAAELARRLAGQGVTVTNPVLRCEVQSYGVFTVGTSNLGLDSGIVLTTGRAATIPGFYGVDGPTEALASLDNLAPGDSLLTVLAGRTTKDACILEFDVVPAGDTVSIDYVFSSEEYINAVCGPYNDVFAFFISGPGIAGSYNMARVPGTDIPVTINTINNGVPGPEGELVNCTDMGPGSPFTAYYNDNSNGTTLTHRGMTTVLRAMHAVTPCQTYHLRIAIADAGNGKYDSGVFLEAGSLKAGDYHVSAVNNIADRAVAVKGCLPGRFRVKVEKTRPVPQTIHYTTSGSAISGTDYMPLADSVVIPANACTADVVVYGIPTALNGTKQLKLVIYSPSVCNSAVLKADSAVLELHDTFTISASPADTMACRGDSVRLRAIGDDIYAYSWLPDNGLSAPDIMTPKAAPVATTSYMVTGYIAGSTCPVKSATVQLTIKETPWPAVAADTQVCYNTSLVLVSGAGAGQYSYSWAGPAGAASTTDGLSIATVDTTNGGVYSITVTNDTNGCSATAFVNVNVFVPPLPPVVTPANYCMQSDTYAIPAPGNVVWYDKDGRQLPVAPVPPAGTVADYLYFAAAVVSGCEGPKLPVTARVERCCDGEVFVPTGFTPNDDGVNDRFRPRPDFSYTVKLMEVYDRWGKLAYSGGDASWDGNYGGMPAPGGTYYYRLEMVCMLGGTMVKTGDVTLIR